MLRSGAKGQVERLLQEGNSTSTDEGNSTSTDEGTSASGDGDSSSSDSSSADEVSSAGNGSGTQTVSAASGNQALTDSDGSAQILSQLRATSAATAAPRSLHGVLFVVAGLWVGLTSI